MVWSSAMERTLHPGAVIGDRCRLGKDCIIHPNAVLYADVILGDRVEVHSGSVLGGDGFGYRQVDGRHVKVPHTGRLEVENDVEIGSNCTIDRATFETSRVGEGTKIDNLVMVGHNNQIGRHNLLCGQVGIAGSCKTGDYVVIAGQAGIKDNTQIGHRVVVGAQAGVHRSIPDGQNVLGSPAIPVREQRRLFQMIARLPEMHRQLRELDGAARRPGRVDPGSEHSGRRLAHPIVTEQEPGCVSRDRREQSSRLSATMGTDHSGDSSRSRSACLREAAGFRSSLLWRPGSRVCRWPASESGMKRLKSCRPSAIRSSGSVSPSSAG